MTGYGNRGMTFESLIEYANRRYRNDGTAVITKQHTHFVPIRNGSGQIVTCKVEEKATVDYMGRIGIHPVAFEAKHSAEDRIALKRVEQHQQDFLRDWINGGVAIGFVLVSFRLYDFFLIPYPAWYSAVRACERKKQGSPPATYHSFGFKTTGKASISKDEMPEAWRAPSGGTAALDYISTAKKLWEI